VSYILKYTYSFLESWVSVTRA